MRRRLYFLVPNVELATKVVDELLLGRIEERHIHVIAKRGTPLADLPEASLLQKSDFVPAVERAVAMGGATGTLAGLVALALVPGVVVAGGAVLLASALASITVHLTVPGAWYIAAGAAAGLAAAFGAGRFRCEVPQCANFIILRHTRSLRSRASRFLCGSGERQQRNQNDCGE